MNEVTVTWKDRHETRQEASDQLILKYLFTFFQQPNAIKLEIRKVEAHK